MHAIPIISLRLPRIRGEQEAIGGLTTTKPSLKVNVTLYKAAQALTGLDVYLQSLLDLQFTSLDISSRIYPAFVTKVIEPHRQLGRTNKAQ